MVTASAPHTFMKNLTKCFCDVVGSVAVIVIEYFYDGTELKGIVIYYGKPPALYTIDDVIVKALLTSERIHVGSTCGQSTVEITLAPS